MPTTSLTSAPAPWRVRKIAVIGPGIVGMPMAALLAHAEIRIGSDEPATVLVVQRPSRNSGWKVASINAGKSPIGGIEPDLDRVVADSVRKGLLSATDDYTRLRDADVILVCVQTDKDGFAPDYGPLFEALTGVAEQLQHKPADVTPLVIFESTLAPSSMTTLVREHFAKYGLVEGKDIFLGNSPNRVMPGRLVERVAASDKIAAGLHPTTPEKIARLYGHIVTQGELHRTNSLTGEIVKTLENAYRDVRIAFSAEVVRYCDERDVDFYALRDQVNRQLMQMDAANDDPNAVPSGGLLVPTVGVGGHCLPKDGILLWWRAIEAGEDTSRSLILLSRVVNDESPAKTIELTERAFGTVDGKRIALLGTAYRFNSEDTRNSPTLTLARQLLDRGCTVTLHDPYVKGDDQNLRKTDLTGHFTNDLHAALKDAQLVIFCTAHREYLERKQEILAAAPALEGVVDACNLYHRGALGATPSAGIGRGRHKPSAELVDAVYDAFRAVERGVANEVLGLTQFFNARYASDDFNRVEFQDVQRIAGTCVTGCSIADPGPVARVREVAGFRSRLADCAAS